MHKFLSLTALMLCLEEVCSFAPHLSLKRSNLIRFGWFDNLFPQLNDEQLESDRIQQFPEQYPATYDLSTVVVEADGETEQLVRPLLKQTMLESREIELVYDAARDGWSPEAFHAKVDGRGGAVVVATSQTRSGHLIFGGYNPKGWASYGGARPSVAAFLFYSKNDGSFQKLQKVGGGGLACARDDPEYGISLGPDGLLIGLQPGREKFASSKLGPYYERGPDDCGSLFPDGAAKLDSLKIFIGVYGPDEDIPYSGAVMDMTSG